jgi:hypothetical protein
VRIGIHVERIVRTGLGARFAADTSAIIEIDNSILSRMQCRDRADFNARCVRAMVAAHYREQSARIGEFSFFDVLDPGAIYSDRNLVLRFAGNSAGMAPDALAVVDDEAVIHSGPKR